MSAKIIFSDPFGTAEAQRVQLFYSTFMHTMTIFCVLTEFEWFFYFEGFVIHL